VKVKVAPPLTLPELKAPPIAVQVWVTESLLTTETVSPTEPPVSPENAKFAIVICRALGCGAVVVVVGAMVVLVVGARVVVVVATVEVGAMVVVVVATVVVVVVATVVVVVVGAKVVVVVAMVVVGARVVVAAAGATVVVVSSMASGSMDEPRQATVSTTRRTQTGECLILGPPRTLVRAAIQRRDDPLSFLHRPLSCTAGLPDRFPAPLDRMIRVVVTLVSPERWLHRSAGFATTMGTADAMRLPICGLSATYCHSQ
jgi:hypothetical protein